MNEVAERNARVIKRWNETSDSAGEIAMDEHVTRSTICGIVGRARAKKLIIRPMRERGPRRGPRPPRIRTRNAPPAIWERRKAKAKDAVIMSLAELTPELCTSMAEATVNVRADQCRFPFDNDGQFYFCEAVQEKDCPYCEEHRELCWAGLPVRRKPWRE